MRFISEHRKRNGRKEGIERGKSFEYLFVSKKREEQGMEDVLCLWFRKRASEREKGVLSFYGKGTGRWQAFLVSSVQDRGMTKLPFQIKRG
jgi:hypothetical protein